MGIRDLLRKRSAPKPPPIEIGVPAPDFSCTDHEGNTVQLGDFAGRRLLLWFFPKASTPG